MSAESEPKPEITLPTPGELKASRLPARKERFREFRKKDGRGACLERIKRALETAQCKYPLTVRDASISTYRSRHEVEEYLAALLRELTPVLSAAGWRVTNSGITAHQRRDDPVQYSFDISLRPDIEISAFYDEDFESDTDE